MQDSNGKAKRQERAVMRQRLNDRLQQRQHQVEQANKDPVNQAALRWLQKANAEINDAYQYCFQLMQWGLEHGLGFPNRRQTDMFEATLVKFESSPNQLSFLSYLKGPDEEPHVTEAQLLWASDKHQAAWKLIDALDTLLSSEPENNGIYPPQYPLRLDGD